MERIAEGFKTKRVFVQGRYRVYSFGPKGRIVTHTRWSRKRSEWEPAHKRKIAEREKVYRSSIVYTYSGRDGMVDFRVWVYTDKPDVTMSDLDSWMDRLEAVVPTGARGQLSEDMVGRELNEEVLKSDMAMEGSQLNQWRGYAEFERGSKATKYYAQQSGSRFMKTRPFTVRR